MTKNKMANCATGCVLEVTGLSLLWLTAVSLNGITLLAFYRKRTLRSSGHRFLLSLTLGNLMMALVLLPMEIYRSIVQPVHLGVAVAYATAYLIGVIVFNVLLIGWDRFLACARNPLFYNRNMSYRRSVVLICLSWILPAGILAPTVFNDGISHAATEIDWESSVTKVTTALIFSLGNYFVPLLALAGIYTKVFCAAKDSGASSQARKNLIFEFDNNFAVRQSLSIEVSKSSASRRFSRQNSSSSFQSFISGQERQKAAHTILWILLTFIATYSLYFTCIVVQAFWPDVARSLPVSFHRAVHFLYLLGTVSNPIVYILSNCALRRDIRRVFMRQEEIRRQSSLQIQLQGSFRHQAGLWHSSTDRCFTGRHSMDVACCTPKSFSSPVLPLITCTSPDLEEFSPEDEDDERRYFPDADRLRSPQSDSQLAFAERLHLCGDSQSNRSLSRKSVSFVEDVACFLDQADGVTGRD